MNSEDMAEIKNEVTSPHSILYDSDLSTHSLISKSRTMDFILGCLLGVVLTVACFILFLALRSTDEFKRYPAFMNGMTYGMAIVLCPLAVICIRYCIQWMGQYDYWRN
jgi:hypothetical protein